MLHNSLFIDIAKLCSLAYLSQNNITEKFTSMGPYKQCDCENVLYKCSRNPILYSSNNDCQVYSCVYDNYLSFCFRGTESKKDIFTDLNISQVPFILDKINEEYYPYVHRGFYNQFTSVKDYIETELKKNNNKKIIFSGHSLGGALATLSSIYFKLKYPTLDITCITFGSPRVGCSKFSIIFNTIIENSYRFVNDNDPIPCIPTSIRFKHVKGLQWINQDKIENEITVWRFYRFMKNTIISLFGFGYNALNDHSCEGYFQDLQKIDE